MPRKSSDISYKPPFFDLVINLLCYFLKSFIWASFIFKSHIFVCLCTLGEFSEKLSLCSPQSAHLLLPLNHPFSSIGEKESVWCLHGNQFWDCKTKLTTPKKVKQGRVFQGRMSEREQQQRWWMPKQGELDASKCEWCWTRTGELGGKLDDTHLW